MASDTGRRIRKGQTVFLPPEPSLWDVRQATKQRLLDGELPQRFRVTYEELYLPRMLNSLLSDGNQLKGTALSFGKKIIGSHKGMLSCAALWDTEHWDGILLHREGAELLCAYLPVMTEAEAVKEHMVSIILALLAEEVDDMPIRLDRQITMGRWSLKRLLHDISEQLDI